MKQLLREVWAGHAELWKAFWVVHIGTTLALGVTVFLVTHLFPSLTLVLYMVLVIHWILTIRAIWLCAANTLEPVLTQIARFYVVAAGMSSIFLFYGIHLIDAPGEKEARLLREQQQAEERVRRMELKKQEERIERIKEIQQKCADRFDDAYIAAGHDPGAFPAQRNQYIKQCRQALTRQTQ